MKGKLDEEEKGDIERNWRMEKGTSWQKRR